MIGPRHGVRRPHAWRDRAALLGSGATLNARADIEAFVRHTGKPFGVYGITHGGRYTQPADKGVLDQARFAFFRDSVSRERAKQQGVKAPVVEWGPDAAFAVDIRDDRPAAASMARHRLEAGKFQACIPKLRAVLVAFVRKAGRKPLLCLEDSSHMEVNKTPVFDMLQAEHRHCYDVERKSMATS